MGNFTEFCGGEFWNTTLTWDAKQPDLTQCFQDSVLIWGPCLWLWITLPLYAHYLSGVKDQPNAVSVLNTSRTILSILLAFLSILESIKYGSSKNYAEIQIVSPVVLAATFVLSAVLYQVERRRGLVTSGVHFIFWVITLVAWAFIFSSKALQLAHGDSTDTLIVTVFYIRYALVLLQFILSCISDVKPRSPYSTERPSPETEASFLSRILFWWINGLVILGYKKGLEEGDLWELHPRDKSDNVAPVFEKAWRKEMESCKRSRGAGGSRSGASRARPTSVSSTSERTPLLSSDSLSGVPDVAVVQKTKEPSLIKVLAKCYGFTLFQAHLCKLVYDILTFVGPQLQKMLIEYVDTEDEYKWKGYLYAVLFFVSSVVSSLFFHQLFHIGMTLGMRIKSAVIAVVYKKALTMSNEARKDTTVGEIVNLMSVDAQRLQDVTGYLWMLWSSPLQIVIALYMLWSILGPSTLAGLAVMILIIPVNAVMASLQRKLQIAQMTQKDQRIKLMNEVLNGIKVLKLYAWELSFQEKIAVIRNMELTTLKKSAYLGSVSTFTWTCAPFVVTLATFTTYVLLGNQLDAKKAFVALSLFNILRFPISLLPMMVTYIVTASVSIKRLGKFLRTEDLDLDNVQHNAETRYPIEIKGGTFAWGTGKDDSPSLKDVDLFVKDSSLLAVVGTVGAGKSSLLSAVLGEMEKLKGSVSLRGSVAYVAQQAWIQNATLKDNILFGKEFDLQLYNQVIEACALKPDLEILPGGDQTEIGEKGINLSGGQKQRVSLARAVYNNADIYLLDDPLSAVDAHVGKHIFENVISDEGLLKGKTRILVTHGLHWLPSVDEVVVISNGAITEMGTYDELLERNGEFAQFLKANLMQEASSDEDDDPEVREMKAKMLERVNSIQRQESATSAATHSSGASDNESGTSSARALRRRISRMSSSEHTHKRKSSTSSDTKPPAKPTGQTLIQEEKSETGKVKMTVYLNYAASLGMWNSFFIMFSFLLFQAASVASNIWLSKWTADPLLNNKTVDPKSDDYRKKEDLYLGVYGGLGIAQALFVFVYAMICAVSMVHASRHLHNAMLSNILRSPMEFFDTTPIGRILNRTSRDVETVDNVLPQLFRSFLNTFFSVVSTIVVISYTTPLFLSVIVPLGILYYFIQRFYIPTSRQLKRIESTTRSPIYVNFSETITGASTIRAYGHQDRFIVKSNQLVDHNLVFYFASIASNRWLGFRLEFVGSIIVFAAAMFSVVGKSSANGVSASLVGLSISYALQVTGSLNWMVRMTSDLETNIVSIERMKEYTETPTEADWYRDDTKPPRSWPDSGKVELKKYSTRYRQGLDLVLKRISIKVNGGEKIGIVGRTGAGKSSLTVALFRLIEASSGQIVIDGIDVSNLGLHQLRSKLTILPQDPVLFSGTLRMNLDPFEKHTDDEIWTALEHAHLKDHIKSLPAGLAYECGEGGQNLSVGQRQLVCLARTLLHKTRILIFDEATAAVDMETDELIQNTIRSEFNDCTILTIAHRLNTIMDNDRVLVLDQGELKEYDSPANLLKNKDGMFYSMAKDAGLVTNGQ